MRSKALLAVLSFSFVATAALAVSPGTDLYIPSVGHAQGKCIDGVCSQWRTDVWIYNPSATAASVDVEFLRRDTSNTAPTTKTVTIAPGETKEYVTIVNSLLNLDSVYGALRFVSDEEVVVYGRIYDANVVTNKGTGTAGQLYNGLPASMAIGINQATSLFGLADGGSTGTWRSNFGFVETTGNTATVQVQLIDATGTASTTKTYSVNPYEAKQFNVGTEFGTNLSNVRLAVSVTAGNGKVLPFASRVDNATGDPSTVEMVSSAVAAHSSGAFAGVIYTSDNAYVDGGMELTLSSSAITSFRGSVGLQCSGYVVDFVDDGTPIAINSDGTFSGQVSIDYSDGSTTLFTTVWTLSGTLGSDGAITGSLASATTGATGSDAACNQTVTRSYYAGWTGQ